MPKLTVYVPKDVYDAVRAADLPATKICQAALRMALNRQSTSSRLRALIALLTEIADDHERRVLALADMVERQGLSLPELLPDDETWIDALIMSTARDDDAEEELPAGDG